MDFKVMKMKQRELKFRAWDKQNWIMEYFTLKDLWVAGCQEQLAELEDSKHLALNSDYPYTEQEIMQYTGQKDKNGKGKEIYHKDIMNNGGIVEWIDDGWFVIYKTYEVRLSLYLLHEESRVTIGNIYETPELLEHA